MADMGEIVLEFKFWLIRVKHCKNKREYFAKPCGNYIKGSGVLHLTKIK